LLPFEFLTLVVTRTPCRASWTERALPLSAAASVDGSGLTSSCSRQSKDVQYHRMQRLTDGCAEAWPVAVAACVLRRILMAISLDLARLDLARCDLADNRTRVAVTIFSLLLFQLGFAGRSSADYFTRMVMVAPLLRGPRL
jgi:hypothetical protein